MACPRAHARPWPPMCGWTTCCLLCPSPWPRVAPIGAVRGSAAGHTAHGAAHVSGVCPGGHRVTRVRRSLRFPSFHVFCFPQGAFQNNTPFCFPRNGHCEREHGAPARCPLRFAPRGGACNIEGRSCSQDRVKATARVQGLRPRPRPPAPPPPLHAHLLPIQNFVISVLGNGTTQPVTFCGFFPLCTSCAHGATLSGCSVPRRGGLFR